MAFVAAPNIVLVELVATKDGQRIENTLHVNVFHEPTTSDLQTIEDTVAAFINDEYVPVLPTEVVLTDIKQTSLHTQNGITKQASFNVPGEITLGAMPNEVSYCISLKSDFRGRASNGRWFMLGIAKSSMDGQNRVSGTYRTDAVAAIQSLIDGIAAVGFAWEIVSYVLNGEPRAGGPVYSQVKTATTFDDIVDSMKRRKPGVGS